MVTGGSANPTAPLARHDYAPFGVEIPSGYASRTTLWGTSDGLSPKFTGQDRDTDTGLDFYQARYLGSGQGRFASADPAGNFVADLTNPQSWNMYSYAFNNPLRFIDPSGLCSQDSNGNFQDSDDGGSFQFSGPCSGGTIGDFSTSGANSVTVTANTSSVDNSWSDTSDSLDYTFFAFGFGFGSNSGGGGGSTGTTPLPGSPTQRNTKGCFNTQAFASTLDQNACSTSKGLCAKYVRIAMEAGGINTTGRPVAAGDYGPFLANKGFGPIPATGYTPAVGDIAVFGKNSTHSYGHVAGFDGSRWVSDFFQRMMNPYAVKSSAGPMSLYRSQNPCK